MTNGMQLYLSGDNNVSDIERGISPPSVRTTSVPPPSPRNSLINNIINSGSLNVHTMNNDRKGIIAIGFIFGSLVSTIHDAISVSR